MLIKSFEPLIALVCGYEKSGTTLLNEILRRHPQLDSGFEGGFLLGESPREFKRFQPYFAFFKKTWELSREDVLYICDTDDWAECYRRARERSPIITNKAAYIFDKTPIYMLHLASVLAKVPGLPCIVNVRDPRSLMLSWANWSGFKDDPERYIHDNFTQLLDRFTSYAEGYYNALPEYGSRIFLNSFEKFCEDPESSAMNIFRFIGLDYSEEFLHFSSKHFVYGNSVSTEFLHPYRNALSSKMCHRILDETSKYADWHYHKD